VVFKIYPLLAELCVFGDAFAYVGNSLFAFVTNVSIDFIKSYMVWCEFKLKKFK